MTYKRTVTSIDLPETLKSVMVSWQRKFLKNHRQASSNCYYLCALAKTKKPQSYILADNRDYNPIPFLERYISWDVYAPSNISVDLLTFAQLPKEAAINIIEPVRDTSSMLINDCYDADFGKIAWLWTLN